MSKPELALGWVPSWRTSGGFDVTRARRRSPFVVVLGVAGIPTVSAVARGLALGVLQKDYPAQAAAGLLYLSHGGELRWPVKGGRPRALFRRPSRRELFDLVISPLIDLGTTRKHIAESESPFLTAGQMGVQAQFQATLPRYNAGPGDDLAFLHDLAVFGVSPREYGEVDDDNWAAVVGCAVGLWTVLLSRERPVKLTASMLVAQRSLTGYIEGARHEKNWGQLAALRALISVGRTTVYSNVAELQRAALEDAGAWVRARPGAPGTGQIEEALQSGAPLHELLYTPRPQFGGQPFLVRPKPPHHIGFLPPAVVDYACDCLDPLWLDRLLDAYETGGVAAGEQMFADLGALSAAIGAARATDRPGIRLPRVTRRSQERQREYLHELYGEAGPETGARPVIDADESLDSVAEVNVELLAQVRFRVEQHLTQRQRKVFWPCVVEKVPQRQMAGRLGVGEPAISKLLKGAWRRIERTDQRLYLQLQGLA